MTDAQRGRTTLLGERTPAAGAERAEAAMAISDAPPTTAGTDAAAEKSKLQQHFGRADVFFFLVCTLVGIDGLGTLATEGGQGFTWLVVCVLLFAVPSAMVLAELGAAYTDEGGPYVWVRMAFGHLAGAVNNFFYWVTNPVWMGGTLVGTALGGLIVFFNDGAEYSRSTTYLFALVFIWAGVLFAVLSFRVGKWVATVGASPGSCCWACSASWCSPTGSTTASTDRAWAPTRPPSPGSSRWCRWCCSAWSASSCPARPARR